MSNSNGPSALDTRAPVRLHEKWPRLDPCPLCGRSSPCIGSPDGCIAVCVRVSAGAYREKSGWFFHRLKSGPRPRPHVGGRVLYIAPPPPRTDFHDLIETYQRGVIRPWLDEFAEAEGLTTAALRRLGVGLAFDHGRGTGADAGDVVRTPPQARCWTWPMWDGDHNLVGILRRWGCGQKRAVLGSHLGLLVPRDLGRGVRLLLCEGATDTAAALGLGFEAVGRANAGAGADDLLRLVRRLRPPEVVVVADVDAHGAGQHGARRLAVRLAPFVRRLKIIAAPRHKDLREWVQGGATAADVQSVIDAADECVVRIGGGR